MPKGNEEVTGRPTLDTWLDEYASIEAEYVAALESMGVEFAPYAADAAQSAQLRAELRARGARFLNGGSSISTGFISSACEACVGDCGSRSFYINLQCNRDCYFCFNPNQADFEEHCAHDTPWREDIDAFAREREGAGGITHVGLTGGEPLLFKDKALAFIAHAHELAPLAHIRLYTSGLAFDDGFCSQAVAAGLNEVRFSVKLDEGEASVAAALGCMEVASGRGVDVMVEMPMIPGALDRMKRLLIQLDARGVAGINLLEFCFPMANWEEFARRGFRLKNPPFEVLYDYGYAGGLAVAGSEREALELLAFAMDEGLSLGVHYCSLDNKNRDQLLQMNRVAALDREIYELADDGLYHVGKAFDADVHLVCEHLKRSGSPFLVDEDELCVSFHPKFAEELSSLGVVVALSYNVVEGEGGTLRVRELSLRLDG